MATRDALQGGKLKKGDLVLFAAVGAGYTVGANLWRWQNVDAERIVAHALLRAAPALMPAPGLNSSCHPKKSSYSDAAANSASSW